MSDIQYKSHYVHIDDRNPPPGMVKTYNREHVPHSPSKHATKGNLLLFNRMGDFEFNNKVIIGVFHACFMHHLTRLRLSSAQEEPTAATLRLALLLVPSPAPNPSQNTLLLFVFLLGGWRLRAETAAFAAKN